jgi:hypothetical protein
MTKITLRHAIVSVSDDAVVCRFQDGTSSTCDITQSHGPKYRETAAFWGYSDHVRYAQHHDLIHCWLWDRLHDQPSPTLWAEAHDLPPPPENRTEEHLVNHVQYTLAQRSNEFSSFLLWHIGVDWRRTLNDLRTLLEMNDLPFPMEQRRAA